MAAYYSNPKRFLFHRGVDQETCLRVFQNISSAGCKQKLQGRRKGISTLENSVLHKLKGYFITQNHSESLKWECASQIFKTESSKTYLIVESFFLFAMYLLQSSSSQSWPHIAIMQIAFKNLNTSTSPQTSPQPNYIRMSGSGTQAPIVF